MSNLLGILLLLGHLFLRVLLWPITFPPLWRLSRTHRRRQAGIDAWRVAGVEPGEAWRLTFSRPRFPARGETPPPLVQPLAEIASVRATTYLDHHGGYHQSDEALHLSLRRPDGSRVSLYEDADAKTLGPVLLPALVEELAARGVPIVRREQSVHRVPGLLDLLVGPMWLGVGLAILGWK